MSQNAHNEERIAFTKILPVLFLEYLAISLARTLFPQMIVDRFGENSYYIVGICETVKGLLAFVSCPLFGKLSDRVGRKICLLISMVGTTMPVWIMVLSSSTVLYMIALSISGLFSATFSLTFAYISDCVDKKMRAPAYGFALATFGLSFTIGPVIGSYIASIYGTAVVFSLSMLLVSINFVYIAFVLPETVKLSEVENKAFFNPYKKFNSAMEHLPNTWDFKETFQVFRSDAFMTNVATIVLIYYTAVWSLVSTLMVYVTRNMHLSPVYLGWLLSAYGLATMISEGILVRIIVPQLGEINSMRLGLIAFAFQCFIIAFSSDLTWIFVSILFSMFSNLVYPSVSSLVSRMVPESQQGEALGALNGIKALTEGFGPLFFGILMSLFEQTTHPGVPYLLVGVLALWGFLHCFEISDEYYRFEGAREMNGAYDSESDESLWRL